MKPGMTWSWLHRAARRTVLSFGVLLVALLAAVVVGTKPAGASTTFTVTDNGDAADSNITDTRCDTDPASGKQCTLRAAIEEANDTNGADTIDFDIGTSGTGAKTISPGSELPAIGVNFDLHSSMRSPEAHPPLTGRQVDMARE